MFSHLSRRSQSHAAGPVRTAQESNITALPNRADLLLDPLLPLHKAITRPELALPSVTRAGRAPTSASAARRNPATAPPIRREHRLDRHP